MKRPALLALDFESILIPEIWPAIGEKKGIKELALTTRDVPDFDKLMGMRLKTLRRHGVTLKDIQSMNGSLELLEGAQDFLDWARAKYQVVLLSDSFYEFTEPFVKKLGYPTNFCNWFEVDEDGFIANYHRLESRQKRNAVRLLKELDFIVAAVGDSYNDVGMLEEADHGMLFRASEQIAEEFPGFRRVETYDELRDTLHSMLGS